MEKLFKILAQGEMPDIFQVLQALNDISDIDWDRVEAEQLSISDVLKAGRVPNYPQICSGQFCDVCG